MLEVIYAFNRLRADLDRAVEVLRLFVEADWFGRIWKIVRYLTNCFDVLQNLLNVVVTFCGLFLLFWFLFFWSVLRELIDLLFNIFLWVVVVVDWI